MNQPAVYILANKRNGTLYTGVTSNLIGRVHQHKNKTNDGFSKRYACNKLVFYEIHDDICSAILREKQIKGGSRNKKIELIEGANPNWKDLYEEMV